MIVLTRHEVTRFVRGSSTREKLLYFTLSTGYTHLKSKLVFLNHKIFKINNLCVLEAKTPFWIPAKQLGKVYWLNFNQALSFAKLKFVFLLAVFIAP